MIETVKEYAADFAIILMAFGLIGYAVALGLAAFGSNHPLSARLRKWFMESPAHNIGIPCSAISAFAVVTVLWRAFPPKEGQGNELALEVFGLTFSGPSGPITLWLLCFLGFVAALRMLRR